MSEAGEYDMLPDDWADPQNESGLYDQPPEPLPTKEPEASARFQAPVAARSQEMLAASPLDLPAEVFQAGLARRGENRKALMAWIREALVDGTDYGRIPTKRGLSKPSLWKSGAEKICGMLGVTVTFPTMGDYEQAALTGVELKHIVLRCEILNNAGQIIGSGMGARALAQDGGDLNKCIKMAQKSAHIDATLRLAGLSEVFTQDLEDMPPAEKSAPAAPAEVTNPSEPAVKQSTVIAGMKINETQRRHIEARITELGLDRERVKAYMARATKGAAEHFRDLTVAQYGLLLQKLPSFAKAEAPVTLTIGAEGARLIREDAEMAGITEQDICVLFGIESLEGAPREKAAAIIQWINNQGK